MFHHIETRQLICSEYQLSGFYKIRTLVVKGLKFEQSFFYAIIVFSHLNVLLSFESRFTYLLEPLISNSLTENTAKYFCKLTSF